MGAALQTDGESLATRNNTNKIRHFFVKNLPSNPRWEDHGKTRGEVKSMAERAKARYWAIAGKEESLRESRKSLMAESPADQGRTDMTVDSGDECKCPQCQGKRK